jgi:hypothetical protein
MGPVIGDLIPLALAVASMLLVVIGAVLVGKGFGGLL